VVTPQVRQGLVEILKDLGLRSVDARPERGGRAAQVFELSDGSFRWSLFFDPSGRLLSWEVSDLSRSEAVASFVVNLDVGPSVTESTE